MMKNLFKHAGQILIGLLIVALFTCIDLNEYPIMRSMDYVFSGLILIFLPVSLIYCWRHKACLLLGFLLLSNPVFAGEYTTEICSYYNSYKARIDAYRKDHFKEDEACDKSIWDKARKESAEYKTSLTDFIVPVYGITKSATNTISEWFDGSCANALMAMCSEYQRRHPETVTKTVPVILNEAVGKSDGGRATSCWPCDMAYVVFVVIQALANNLSGLMSSVAFMLLFWGTMFWLVYKAAGMVLTAKGGTYFSQIAGGLLAVIVAAWFLRDDGRNLSLIYSKFLSPVMQVGLNFADEIQGSVGMNSSAYSSITGSSQPFYKELESRSAALAPSRPNFTDYCGDSSSSSSGSIFGEIWDQVTRWAFPSLSTNFSQLTTEAGRSNQTLLTDELKAQLLCMTQRFYNQSRPFIATGQSLVSFAVHDTTALVNRLIDLAGYDTLFPTKFTMFLVGVFFIALFTYFSFLVAFRIMDIFLRLGFVLVLMPLFITAAVFKVTREYAVKAWTFLFHIIVEFLGLAISASFVMIMLEGVITDFNRDDLLNAMAAPYTEEYGDNLLNAVTDNMTLSFPFLLLAVVIMGSKLMRSFPIIIATLFGVPDSSGKGKSGTMMSAAIGGAIQSVQNNFQKAKGAAGTIAKNPYQTKETKAKEAEKDLNDKKRKLEEEKRKPNNDKNIKKAQKDVDDAQKKAEAFRAQADAEKEKTGPSHSGYAARRFGYDSGNAVRKGGGAAAEAVDKFGSKVGGFLMKSGVGAVAGVPIVLGAKVVSAGIRAGAKTTEVGLKAAGRAGATVQKWGNKLTGKAPPPRKP